MTVTTDLDDGLGNGFEVVDAAKHERVYPHCTLITHPSVISRQLSILTATYRSFPFRLPELLVRLVVDRRFRNGAFDEVFLRSGTHDGQVIYEELLVWRSEDVQASTRLYLS